MGQGSPPWGPDAKHLPWQAPIQVLEWLQYLGSMTALSVTGQSHISDRQLAAQHLLFGGLNLSHSSNSYSPIYLKICICSATCLQAPEGRDQVLTVPLQHSALYGQHIVGSQ